MQLAAALRFSGNPCLALVGAGGKTTALFTLARQISPPVFVTTTTHLSTAQLALADQHISLEHPDALSALKTHTPEAVIVFTGPILGGERVSGPNEKQLENLRRLSVERRIPLLIEADGSRQRPLKAPGEHEPVLPPFVEVVVVSAGLSGLGKPLTGEWVHRPEIYAELSGLKLGEPVTLSAIARVLLHPQGGLKDAPAEARRVALLNQADTPDLQAVAQRLAADLLVGYHAVLVASLEASTSSSANQEFDKDDFMAGENGPSVYAVYERVAGVILAAGASTMLGRPKQLLEWQGRPLVWSVARTALESGLAPVVVVTGAHGDRVARVVENLPVKIVHNESWVAGQSSSLRRGLESLPEETGAAVFLLSDQPQIPTTLVRSLLALHASTLSPVVAPIADGRRANPVLFDRQTFADLGDLSGDVGGRAIFSKYPVTWMQWHDPDVLLDVDTEGDYQRLLQLET